MTWRPVSDEIKDGRLCWVAHRDCGAFLMRWSPNHRNGLIPDVFGMWVSPDGGFTWTERSAFSDDYLGPSHWAPGDEPRPEGWELLPDDPKAVH